MLRSPLLFLAVCIGFCMQGNTLADDRANDALFAKVSTLFSNRCSSCHYGAEPKGGLDLFSQETFRRGGDSGAIVPASASEGSVLWEQVSSDSMPPDKPLTQEEKSILQSWLEAGSPWSAPKIDPHQFSTESRAGRDWWSLQTLSNIRVPLAESKEQRNGIDAWIEDKLRTHGLKPSPAADKRTFLRRVYMDLIGIPPTAEAVQDFLQDDAPDAYEKVVDALLASPQYGERWARHWLDVVRFGESNGFEYDEPRDHFWHYRNWVIHSLNGDMPYDEFVRLQLAGDLIAPNDFSSHAATGFLVAGPHNTTLPANDKMRMSMAQDELEDLVGTVSQTFLGLTANCARCHDHKFDPIRQTNYYELAATLTGVTHGERTISIPFSSDEETQLKELRTIATRAEQERNTIEQSVRMRILEDRKIDIDTTTVAPQPIASWDFGDLNNGAREQAPMRIQLHPGATRNGDGIQFDGKRGFASSSPLEKDIRAKTLEVWVKLDGLEQRGGAAISIQSLDGSLFDAIVFGEKDPKRWMAGSNGFARTQPFHGDEEHDADKRHVHFAIAYGEDGSITAYRDGLPYGQPYKSQGIQVFTASNSQIVFGLRHAPVGGNRMLAGNVRRARLYDRALDAREIQISYRESERTFVSPETIAASMSQEQRSHVAHLVKQTDQARERVNAIVQSHQVPLYGCVSTPPKPTHVLRRGDVGSPSQLVSPRGLDAISNYTFEWDLLPDSSDSDRRIRLAQWISHRSNPLFARVIANRLWHYHFGKGIVDTPNDFGFQGSRPTYPELLDYLASCFQEEGMRWKPLHRQIVLSRTYRQSSSIDPDSYQRDADNKFVWRKSPIRLEAEEVRDSMLCAAGLLDHSIGGKGYRDVRHEFFRGSHFYHRVDEASLSIFRRTIYRFAPRGGRNPFLETFDCPDPSTVTPRRANTTTPIQALAMLNNSLVLEVADRMAQRAKMASSDSTDENEILETVYRDVFQRAPSIDEATLAKSFIAQHGLAAFCRVLLNSNEYLYVR